MKTHRFLAAGIAGLLLLLSCRSERTPSTLIRPTATQVAPPAALSEVVDTCRFIPLAAGSDEALVGRISKILKYKEKFYIASDRKRLLVFHADGRFSHRIDRQGRGPQEYTELTDFDIADDRIAILSHHKIGVYTLDGTYLSNTTFDFNALRT